MQHDFDVIVMGVGGMGSASLCSLARRGAKVCGIERFGIAHDRGSSHGDTRVIRKAYFEHPDYMPLLHRAYELWEELEEASGVDLFNQCGFLTLAHPGSETIRGLDACYRAHDVAHERLGRGDIASRFPQFVAEPGMVGFFDPFGGYLRVEECVAQHVAQARAAGAELLTETPVSSWEAVGDGVIVRTADAEVTARRLVIATGAWSVPGLELLGIEAHVWRKVLFWHDAPDPEPFLADRFPTFYVEKEYGHFYGFPSVDERGVKVAEHLAETPIDDPSTLDREAWPEDAGSVRRFVSEMFPGVLPDYTSHAVCMYTVTPDWNFVIDRHPQHPQVVIVAGFSGHGFKFASVVGEIAGDLALEGETRHPIEFLGIGRFGSSALGSPRS